MYNNYKIQETIQCLNISDLDFYSEIHDLTDDESSNISGGILGGALGGYAGSAFADISDSKGGKHRKPPKINQRQALAQGIGNALGGLAGYYMGGVTGAALAGED